MALTRIWTIKTHIYIFILQTIKQDDTADANSDSGDSWGEKKGRHSDPKIASLSVSVGATGVSELM